MRIRISFETFEKSVINFDYQHQFQGIIYNFLKKYNAKYSNWLHQEGYLYGETQHFKMFSYSGIVLLSKIKVLKNKGFLLDGSFSKPGKFYFEVSSPVKTFIEYLVRGIFKEGSYINLGKVETVISKVETLKEIDASNGSITVKPLKCPIVVKRLRPNNNGYDFVFHTDSEFTDLLTRNALKKYNLLMGTDMNDPIQIEVREDLAGARYNLDEKRTWLTSVAKWYKVNGKANRIVTLGTTIPLTITGKEEILSKIVDLGLGDSTSMGCGYLVECKSGENE